MDRETVKELIQSNRKKDLHIHSVFSDGVLTPEEIADRWKQEGYEIISVTDHDGIGGSIAAVGYAEKAGITVIPGIEFDSADDLGRDLHILGYGIDFECDAMKNALDRILSGRRKRNEDIRRILKQHGYDVSEAELFSVNQGRYIGKPTFAKVLVDHGEFKDIADVFRNLFSKLPEFHTIKKEELPSAEVVEIIHGCGGLAVLAHPMEQMKTSETFEEFEPVLIRLLDRFTEYGIDGIECYHPSASPDKAEYLRKYAENHELLWTIGSDFHYDGMSRVYTRD